MGVGEDVARTLLGLGAVAINIREPFVYTSGTKSPIYCDNRLIISFPPERRMIVEELAKLVEAIAARDGVDVIAGTATAGIPWAAWVAERLEKPMVYVRPKAKGHGRGRQIEGRLDSGQRVAIVEDLISTGGSSLGTARAIRSASSEVAGCAAIFTYGFASAAKAFADAGVRLSTLSDIATLLDVAVADRSLTAEDRRVVKAWLAEQEAA